MLEAPLARRIGVSGKKRDHPESCRIIGCCPSDPEHDAWVVYRVDIGR